MSLYIFLWAAMVLFLTVSATKLALKRGQNPYFWALATLLFGFFALAILYLIPTKTAEQGNTPILATYSEINPSFPEGAHEPLNPSMPPKDYRLWYYLDPQGKSIGPMSKKALLNCLKEGQITQQSFIWSDHMTDWKKMLDVSEMQG